MVSCPSLLGNIGPCITWMLPRTIPGNHNTFRSASGIGGSCDLRSKQSFSAGIYGARASLPRREVEVRTLRLYEAFSDMEKDAPITMAMVAVPPVDEQLKDEIVFMAAAADKVN